MKQHLFRSLQITFLFVVSAQLLFLFGHRSELSIEMWLPAGVLLGACLRYGAHYAWLAIPGYLIIEYSGLNWQLPVWVLVLTGFACAMQAYATVRLIELRLGREVKRLPRDAWEMTRLLFWSGFPVPFVTTFVALSLFYIAGAFAPSALPLAFLTWCTGSITGTVVGMPAFLLFAEGTPAWHRKFIQLVPVAITVLVVAVVVYLADHYYDVMRQYVAEDQLARVFEMSSARFMFIGLQAVSIVLVSWANFHRIAQGAHVSDLNEKLEAKQRSLEEETAAVLETMTDAVLVTDAVGRIMQANQAALVLTDSESAGLIGMSYTELFECSCRPSLLELVRKSIAAWKITELHEDNALELILASGRAVPVEAFLSPFQASDGSNSCVIVIRDLTERQLRLQAVIEKEVAEQASQAKSQFLNTVRHELRTPLNAIIGYSELILEDGDTLETDEAQDYQAKVLTAARKLNGLLESVLTISALDAGDLPVEPVEFSLSELETAIRHDANRIAASSTCEVAVTSEFSGLLSGDVRRMREAVLPLIDNAVKFGGDSAFSIDLAVKNADQEPNLSVYIRDTGPGLEETDLKKVFEAFSQVDGSTTRRYGGLGIGLTLSRAYAESMGGRISVESKKGEGSTFSLHVPVRLSR